MNQKIIFLVMVALVFTIPSAFAHKLLAVNPENTMKEIATEIPDPSVQSWFTLEEFEKEGQSHWYYFIGKEGQEILIQALVPDLEHSRNFNPSFDLLIGDEKVIAKTANLSFIEPYSNTNWFVKAELRYVLPDDGIYYIRAHDQLHHYAVGDIGKFSLGIGEREQFSFIENLLIPLWVLYVNMFFENLMFVWISLVLVFILVVIILALLARRNEKQN